MTSYALLYFVPDGNLTAMLAVVALMGLGNGGTLILPPAMTADAIDNDRLIAGVEQAGGHMAFLAFAFKFGMGLGALVGLGLLGLMGYQSLGQPLDAALEHNVRLVAGWLPALLLVVPIVAMWRYPIDSARHAQIRAELEARGRGQSA